MNAEILCVGSEILLGDIVNTNAAFLSRQLAELGINCYYQSVVGDNPERIRESLRLAFSRADMVITTGGLGPTYDDITKEVVADYFGAALELHPPSLEHIKNTFAKLGATFTPNNEKQAFMPRGGVVFDNNWGTAPGFAIEGGGKTAIMLPGPPREMVGIFLGRVRPYLEKRSDKVFVSTTIHLFGIGESAAEAKLSKALLEQKNPTIAPYAKAGEVQLRLTASAPDKATAEEMLAPLVEQVRGVFRENVYGVDVGSMQAALIALLSEKNETLALAESCTGGMLSARLTEIPGASAVLLGGVVCYSNESKVNLIGVKPQTLEEHGAVSEQTASEMAVGVRSALGADIGLSITGVAGPGGGTPEKPVGTVYISCATKDGVLTQKLALSRGHKDEREVIRNQSCLHAMNLVRNMPEKRLFPSGNPGGQKQA